MTFTGIPDREHLLELRIIGRHMRAAQRKYFKTRNQSDLLAAKNLEKRFDDIIERQLEPDLVDRAIVDDNPAR